jgi:Spy/CpxP family protein refolding chaperone
MRRWSVLVGLVAVAAYAVATPSYGLVDDGTAGTAVAVADQPVSGAVLTEVQPATPVLGADTADQPSPAGTRFQQVRTDIQALRADAKAQIRALLTEEQQAQFDALNIMNGPPDRPGCGQGPCGKAGGWARPGGPGAMHSGERAAAILNHLTQKLSLTDAQQAQVQTILDNTRTAMQARHEQARTDFRAILTPEQTATLDQLKASGESPKAGRWAGHRKGAAGTGQGPLQLTDEQKTQAKAIFTQVRTDVQQLHADARQQIRAVLTDEQKTQFDAMHPAGGKGQAMGGGGPKEGVHGAWGGGMHGPRGGQGGPDSSRMLDHLTTALNLTDAQRASVQTILDNLRTSIHDRIQQARQTAPANVSTPSTDVPSETAK